MTNPLACILWLCSYSWWDCLSHNRLKTKRVGLDKTRRDRIDYIRACLLPFLCNTSKPKPSVYGFCFGSSDFICFPSEQGPGLLLWGLQSTLWDKALGSRPEVFSSMFSRNKRLLSHLAAVVIAINTGTSDYRSQAPGFLSGKLKPFFSMTLYPPPCIFLLPYTWISLLFHS